MSGDGGPAFPTNNSPGAFNATGMTLRDWFAGQAMAAFIAEDDDMPAAAAIAAIAYAYADAMLEERDK